LIVLFIDSYSGAKNIYIETYFYLKSGNDSFPKEGLYIIMLLLYYILYYIIILYIII